MKNDSNEAAALANEIANRKALELKLVLYEDLILHQTNILEQNRAEIEDHLSIIQFQAQYNEAQSRRLSERSHELRTYYNAIQGLSEVTRLIVCRKIDSKFNDLGLKIKQFNNLNEKAVQDIDHKQMSAIVREIELLESDISKSLIQASANLVIIEQSSKAGIIYTSLILDESEMNHSGDVQTASFDFDECIAASVKMFREGKLAMKEINLKCKFDAIGHINSSKYHLQIIINNLIANAINYTPKFGNITLIVTAKIEADIKSIVFVVQDSGEGITEENINKIREKFKNHSNKERFDRLSSAENQGSGVGLINVLRCVNSLNGEIGVKSRGVGKGSTFVVTLPLN